jgi:C-terminal peptidase prc
VSAARTVGLAALLLIVLAAGLWAGGHPAKLPPPLRDVFVDDSAGLTAEASELIEGNYYRAVPEEELADSSLRGMVRGLRRIYRDRFSEYFSAAMLTRFNEEIEGRFSGIGLSVTEVGAGLRVVDVFERSPAERAGIEVGETIVSVDGRSIAGLGSNAATALIKGPEGTEVTVGVRARKGGEARRERLTRAEIRVPVVDSELVAVDGEKLGYAHLAAFSEGAHGALKQAVRRLQKRGAEGLVLDLRGNGGGLLEEAVLTASVFLPEGETVVTTESRTQAVAADRRPDRPRHRLRGGDPRRGAGRQRRGGDRRRALLRQGRLPAGDRPLQRRRAEADRGRVLHPRRDQPGRRRDRARRACPRPPRHAPRRGAPAGARRAGGGPMSFHCDLYPLYGHKSQWKAWL